MLLKSEKFQQTLNNEIFFKGIGLHTGEKCTLKLIPAPINYGIKFFIKNKNKVTCIPATIDYVNSTVRGTNLFKNNISIFTVEHLLSALYALDIHNLKIEVSANELPILDGSSKVYLNAIKNIGIKIQSQKTKEFVVNDIISFQIGSPYNEWHFIIDGKPKVFIAKGMLQLNHGDAILRSCINGGGIAVLSRFVVGRHIASGKLISLLDQYLQEDIPIYAVYPSGKHLSLKVRAFLDFLIDIYGHIPYWDESGDHKSLAAKRASL